MYTDPDQLLPEHHHLITIDKEKVYGGTLTEQRTWIVRMKAARKAWRKTTGDRDEVDEFSNHEVETD